MPRAAESSWLSGARFAPTRWTVVRAAQAKDSPQCAAALEMLCGNYWQPLYAFARRQGCAPADAQDLTQEFFARLLAKNYLRVVAPEKGRFRSFLLVAFKRFLARERERARAQKRGGGQAPLTIDRAAAEALDQAEPAETVSADRVYERRWALTLLDRALARLRREFAVAGREREFERLKGFLTAAPAGDVPAAAVSGAQRVAVHRLRRRFLEIVRAEIAQTVAEPGEIDDEIRHLLSVLADG